MPPSTLVVAGRWRSATETRRCARHPCLEAAQPGLIAHYQRSTPPTSLVLWVARLCPPGQMRRRPAGHRRDAAFIQRDQSLETAAYFAAVLEVRIHLPPAKSQRTIGSAVWESSVRALTSKPTLYSSKEHNSSRSASSTHQDICVARRQSETRHNRSNRAAAPRKSRHPRQSRPRLPLAAATISRILSRIGTIPMRR